MNTTRSFNRFLFAVAVAFLTLVLPFAQAQVSKMAQAAARIEHPIR